MVPLKSNLPKSGWEFSPLVDISLISFKHLTTAKLLQRGTCSLRMIGRTSRLLDLLSSIRDLEIILHGMQGVGGIQDLVLLKAVRALPTKVISILMVRHDGQKNSGIPEGMSLVII